MNAPVDPYRAPDSATAAAPAVPVEGPLATWVIVTAMLAPIFTALFVIGMVPQFEDVFRNFGAELPLLTHLVAENTMAVVLWPLAVAGVAVAWRRRARRGVALLALSILGSLAVVALIVAAIYLPIFRLAATV